MRYLSRNKINQMLPTLHETHCKWIYQSNWNLSLVILIIIRESNAIWMVNSACRRLHWRIYEKDTSFPLLFQLNRSLLTSCLIIIFKISYNTHLITQHCNTSFLYYIFSPISGRYHPLDKFFIYLLYITMKNNTGIVTDISLNLASHQNESKIRHITFQDLVN